MTWARSDHLARLDGVAVEAVVIGGGIVGAGAALDLAARGASVALIEQDDFAGGTSGKSTKLLHGGIRYMPQLHFGLVREGLREQSVLAETADYLYRPLDFVLPLYKGVSFGDLPTVLGHHAIVPTALRVGLFLYDRLGGRRDGHRRVGAAEARELAPCLRPDGLEGAFVYRDAQTEDARLTIGIIKAAVQHQALAVNHARVTEVASAGAGYRLGVSDRLGGAHLELTAKTVIAAAGSFPPPHPQGRPALGLRYSRGSHILADLDDVGLTEQAVVLPETDDERILYMIPWLNRALVGTTDVPCDGDDGYPRPSPEEIDYLVRHVERFTGRRPVPRTAFAGMRALAATDGTTASASREALAEELAPGFYQVAGGKLTGYRVIAQEVADLAAAALGLDRPSLTASIPIAGAGDGNGAGPLWDRYGSDGTDVEAIVAGDPGLGSEVGEGILAAEVVYATRHEAAVTIGDFALRRTRLSWLATDHGREAAAVVADLMGGELGWSPVEREAQLEGFTAELATEGL